MDRLVPVNTVMNLRGSINRCTTLDWFLNQIITASKVWCLGNSGAQYKHSWKWSSVRGVKTDTSNQAATTTLHPQAINLSDPHQCSSLQGIKMVLTHPTYHALHTGMWWTQLLLCQDHCHYKNERLFKVRTPWSHAPGMDDNSATMTWSVSYSRETRLSLKLLTTYNADNNHTSSRFLLLFWPLPSKIISYFCQHCLNYYATPVRYKL